MPFAVKNRRKIKINLKKDRVPLQVQRSMVDTDKNRGRVFLSAFQNRIGSITLEAALVVPIFLLIIVSVLYFMVIIYVHLNIQIAIEEIGDDLATKMYAVQTLSNSISSVQSSDDTVTDITSEQLPAENISDNKTVSSEIKELISKGITAAWLYQKTANKIKAGSLNSTYIVNGAAGLNFINSEFDMDSGIGDIIVNYKIRIPFMPDAVKTLEFTQRCRFRFWTGISLQDESDKNVVYITINGTVYHTELTCRHLNLSIAKTTYADMLNSRNENGAKYSACAYCASESVNSTSIVYITSDGTKYHSSLGCSGLKRGIITVDISEVSDMPQCSSCAGSQ